MLPGLVAGIAPSLRYQGGALTRQQFQALRLHPEDYDGYDSEDQIVGTLHGATIRCAEVRTTIMVTRSSGENRRRSKEPVFMGRVIMVRLPLAVPTPIMVRDASAAGLLASPAQGRPRDGLRGARDDRRDRARRRPPGRGAGAAFGPGR